MNPFLIWQPFLPPMQPSRDRDKLRYHPRAGEQRGWLTSSCGSTFGCSPLLNWQSPSMEEVSICSPQYTLFSSVLTYHQGPPPPTWSAVGGDCGGVWPCWVGRAVRKAPTPSPVGAGCARAPECHPVFITDSLPGEVVGELRRARDRLCWGGGKRV